MIIRRLLLCRALSKGSKVGLRNVYLGAFDLGLRVLIGQSELSAFPPAPGLLIDSSGYEVTQLTETDNYRTSQIISLAISQSCLCLIIEKYTRVL